MTLLGDIGTIDWCRRTNGILGRGERARFLAAMLMKNASATPRLIAARAGARGSGPDPSELAPPDTPFTRDVVEACADLDAVIVEHGYRSYLFARTLGTIEGIDCDEEAMFAAAMLHDYAFGMTDTIVDKCFTLVGAEIAAEVLASSPLDESLRHDVLDAITLHINPTVPREQGELQHLVHDGIIIDVFGLRSWELSREGVQRVHERHPRHGFTVRAESILRTHSRRVPGCRTRVLFAGGFKRGLKTGPWWARDHAETARTG